MSSIYFILLNLYKNYIKFNKNLPVSSEAKSDTIKDYPSSIREWKDSIYVFNKNNLNFIPETNKVVLKLIKSYFNLYNAKLENKLRKSKIRKRFRKLSSNKIYISNGTFKHTNNKVIVTLYVYNRQKINYTYLVNRKFKKFFVKKLNNKLTLFRSKISNYMKKMEKNKLIILNTVQKENDLILLLKYKSLFLKYYDIKTLKKVLKKIYRKYKKYFLYKQLLYVNRSKFNYNYLSLLNTIIKKVYNKNVQFDIVNLKYFYLNSDIFSQSILQKVRKNRRKLLRVLKYILIRSNITKINKFLLYEPIIKNTLSLNKGDPINYLVLKNAYVNRKTVKKTALALIKHKRVVGVRLEAKGRLTRRYTASRSVSKLRYRGNLINIDSSRLGLSSVLLRGNLRSNLQYTKLKSKTRIGSFGLKGWISGY